ncbi:hypothetical protein DSECCO2_08660 [anaerobic digester metagenome]
MEMQNKPWNLESFIDALVMELDKTREILAIKAINKPLSYSVKDMALDLQIFPIYDGDSVFFTTAKPGELGSSKITLNLGSITDQVVRVTSTKLPTRDDASIDKIDLDETTKKELKKIGINSIRDLEEIEKKNVDIQKITSNKKIDYTNLANLVKKAKRNRIPPEIKNISMSMENGRPFILIEGKNLAIQDDFNPVAILNHEIAGIVSCNPGFVKIDITDKELTNQDNELVLALDPYSVLKVRMKEKGNEDTYNAT